MSPNKACKALQDKGLSALESQRAIDFCTQHCPYSYCVVAEPERGPPLDELAIQEAKQLRDQGVTPEEIALKLHKSKRTIYRYLE